MVSTAFLICGCSSSSRKNDTFGTEFRKAVTEPFAPLYDLSMMGSGAVDLLYCSTSFHRKNGRWPDNYEELSDYVKQSNGYLALGQYERVTLNPTPNDGLEVRYVRPGHTNEMKFTLEDKLQRK